jgi:NitT/TauT family transport system substrate-binding protein
MKGLRLAVGTFVALVLTACTSERAPEQELTRVRVGAMPFLSSAPLTIARDRGFFREEGIDIELMNQNANDGVAALAAGHADVYANFLSVGLVNARHRGAMIRIVADKGSGDATACVANGLVVRAGLSRERALSSAAGIRGLVFGVRPMTTGEYLVDRMLETLSVPRDAVRILTIPTEATADSLQKGVIDAGVMSEPSITRFHDLGIAEPWHPFSDVASKGQWGVIAFGPRLLERERDLGLRFLRAYLRGVRAYAEGKTAANLKSISAMTGDDPNLLRRACWPSIRRDGQVSAEGIADFIAWGRDRGYVESAVDSGDLIDTRLLAEASRGIQ